MSTMIMKSTELACDVCEKTWEIVKKVYSSVSDICTTMGYARAASVLASQGLYKEAEYLMKYNVKKVKK